MKAFYLFISVLLLRQSLGQNVDELPRKHNIISTFVNIFLGKAFDEICGNIFRVEEVDLTEDVGKFLNVEAGIMGGMTKAVDGYKSYGFTLDSNVTNILVKGQYDLVHLDVPGLFPFFGKGDFSISIGFVNLNMLLDANYDLVEEKFDIDIARFNILAKNTTVNFVNLMNDPHLADFLNELLSNLLPDVFVMLTDPLLKLSKPLIDKYGNGIFLCIKTKPLTIEKCIKDLFEVKKLDKIIPSKFSIDLTDLSKITELKKFF